ncbi:MAG TPA: helix-turn-helix transcriptional regulator [Burkholderiaceae bacterium]|nr:helix-turn-helix transcriptional regulator [Burkholderiaceae bacterium]
MERAVLSRMLIEVRQAAGVNQDALAELLGLTQSEVSKFERGERAMDVLRLRTWLGALQVEWTRFAVALERELRRLDTLATGAPPLAATASSATDAPSPRADVARSQWIGIADR